MEDLKRYLNEAAKHSFWIITGLILILASVVFFLTKTSLDQAITSRISALESSFGKINQVKGKVPTQPNDKSHVEMEKRLDGLKRDVEQAWQFQYERQKEFLTWPRDAFNLAKTHEIFDGLRPFEKLVPFPLPDKPAAPLDQITERDRDVYRKYIAPEFPALASRIGSSWKYKLDAASMAPAGGFAPPGGSGSFAPPGMGGSSGTAAANPEGARDLVRWDEASQKELATAVLPWFSNVKPPSIHEIYYAQEDIWVLRGLMDIISQTNSDAKENFQAIVKEIEWIRMGSKASRDAGKLNESAAAAGGMGGMPGYGGGGPPSGYSGGGSGGAPAGYGGGGGLKGGDLGASRAAVRVDPADGRYVDTNFKPLTGAQLRTAMNLTTANDAVNAVAKKIPIRLRLKVDETQIGRLITECGNGKMMLEVLQVRYNTDPAPAVAAAGGAGGGAMAGGGAKPSFGGAGGAGMMGESESGGTTGGAVAAGVADSSGEVAIEIFGLVYLYNPPASLTKTNATPGAAAPAANGAAAGAPAAVNANGAGNANAAPANAAGANPNAGAGNAANANGAAGAATTPTDPANPGDAAPEEPEGGTPPPSDTEGTSAPVEGESNPPVDPATGGAATGSGGAAAGSPANPPAEGGASGDQPAGTQPE
ncbi:MAG: hypothetical protein ACK5OB_16195 [Pirellula sp.]